MPQCTNILMGAVTEIPKGKMSVDGQDVESDGFINALSEAEAEASVEKLTPSKQEAAEQKADIPPAKTKDEPGSTDSETNSKLIFKQIELAEKLEKSQNSAASGIELPAEFDDASLTNEFTLTQVGQAELSPQANYEMSRMQRAGDSAPIMSQLPIMEVAVAAEGGALTASETDDSEVVIDDVALSSLQEELNEGIKLIEGDESVVMTETGLPNDLGDKISKQGLEEPLTLDELEPITSGAAAAASKQIDQLETLQSTEKLAGASPHLAKQMADLTKNSHVSNATAPVNNETQAIEESELSQGDNKSLSNSATAVKGGTELTAKQQIAANIANAAAEGRPVFNDEIEKRIAEANANNHESSLKSSSLNQSNNQAVRPDLPQITASLRQGNEQQVQMQQMIQRFSPVMKQQLMTMVSKGIQQAEIRLDPAELGSMVVKIQVHGDKTQVQFHATQPQTREVLEQAMPRLKDMLSQQGLELTDGQVSQQQSQQQGQQQSSTSDDSHRNPISATTNEIAAEELRLSTNQATSYAQGIDYYA